MNKCKKGLMGNDISFLTFSVHFKAIRNNISNVIFKKMSHIEMHGASAATQKRVSSQKETETI